MTKRRCCLDILSIPWFSSSKDILNFELSVKCQVCVALTVHNNYYIYVYNSWFTKKGSASMGCRYVLFAW